MTEDPGLEVFLNSPLPFVQQCAPASLVYAAAGTRRSAALEGFSSTGDAFVHWSHGQMLDTCDLIFRHGVRHIFTILAAPGQFAEVGSYRNRLIDWIQWGLASDEARAAYACYPWRVRLWTDGSIPELLPIQEETIQTSTAAQQTLWCLVISDIEALWQHILSTIVARCATTRKSAIAACYGRDVPPITMYLAFGKPVLTPDLLPPLLMDKVHCYWTQRPGYRLSEEELRRILYDYAFVRPTWQLDKSTRAEAALASRSAWECGPILGLGKRLGPFWYPEDFKMPSEEVK
jgi:hypothetical protein